MRKFLTPVLFFLFFSITNAQWTSQTSGVSTLLRSVCVVDENICWMAGDGGKVLRTTDGGTTWTNVSASPIPTSNLDVVRAIDANTALVACTPSATYVYRTTNGGNTWAQVFTQTGGYIDDIGFKDANTGFMYGDPVGSRWSLWKTTNNGATWDSTGLYLAQESSEAGWDNAMTVQGNNIWFGTNYTRVYYSTDFGSSWDYGETSGMTNSNNVCFNGDTGFAATSGAIMISTDGGEDWVNDTLIFTGSIHFATASGLFWFVSSSDTNIYCSRNNGTNFSSEFQISSSGGYPWGINSKLVGDKIICWIGCTTGGIYKSTRYTSGISSNTSNIPEKYILSQNYPNPFNPVTNIKFGIPKNSFVTIKVYDILGKEIATLVNKNLTTGSYNVSWNAGSFNSGVYFYRIQAGSFTDAKKMILVK
jgi:photosystem II stability/assembly factor-like uncharacterized protein